MLRKLFYIVHFAFAVSSCDSISQPGETDTNHPVVEVDDENVDEEDEIEGPLICEVKADSIIEPDSLAALYLFDGDYLDYSGNCRHAESGGSPDFVEGLAGQALRFDGLRDFVRIPAELSALPASSYTVTMLMKLLHERWDPEVVASWTGACLWYKGWNSSAGRFQGFSFCDEGGGSGFRPASGTWVMIVVRSEALVLDHKSFRIRKIGDENINWISRWDASAGEITGGREILLGTRETSSLENGDRFQGVIDEVRVYNRTLTVEEEKRIFDYYSQFIGQD